MERDRLDTIIESAQAAFWGKVAELVPEAETGDMDDPYLVRAFELSSRVAVKAWIDCNAPAEVCICGASIPPSEQACSDHGGRDEGHRDYE